MSKHPYLLFALVALLALATPRSEAAVTVQVAGDTATAQISVAGIDADLTLNFDDADGLSAAALGIDAQLVDPLDAGLLGRLPNALTSLPAAFPLLITVEPPLGTGFEFRNTVRVEVHTHALPYTAGTHLRLFKAPLGGQFVDVTDEVAPGSVRTRGTSGGFSQFLVLTDLRPTSQVLEQKLQVLEARSVAAPLSLRINLLDRLQSVRASVAASQFPAALAALDDFRALVSANDVLLGNQWSPAARTGNVAGDLLAVSASLRYSIGYLRDYGN